MVIGEDESVRAIQAKKKRPKRPTAKIKQQIQSQATGDRANNQHKNGDNNSSPVAMDRRQSPVLPEAPDALRGLSCT
ncbi:hypothetical protein FJT64_026100 [Amphibalanus amphitrite]|uniref:Uncharacterized protein n=1 Tax=Amphibalanus amphitrite TaxID=1232801 RepID=A0A6A4W923_AMPAM|nr:hypothetical protein FJT64_026100 [Amphibalanus amphitrite]